MNWILVFLGVLLVLSMIVARMCHDYDFSDTFWKIMAGISGTLFTLGLFVFLCTYWVSSSSNAELVAFHKNVLKAYQLTARRTAEMKVGPDSATAPSIVIQSEFIQQAPEAARRLQELREKIEWYNNTLQKKQDYYRDWFMRQWIKRPPDLPAIEME